MWNETKSLTLSKLCVKLFMALLIGLGVSAPFWLKSLLAFYSELGLEAFYAYFLMTIYAFIGLILRVVKNVVQLAVVLKDENDYTI